MSARALRRGYSEHVGSLGIYWDQVLGRAGCSCLLFDETEGDGRATPRTPGASPRGLPGVTAAAALAVMGGLIFNTKVRTRKAAIKRLRFLQGYHNHVCSFLLEDNLSAERIPGHTLATVQAKLQRKTSARNLESLKGLKRPGS